MDEIKIIEDAKKGFDRYLHTGDYVKIHADSEHLESLIELIDVRKNKKYIDIGTGSGYIAFELAKRYPEILVLGIDIAENAIKKNLKIKNERKLTNLDFLPYQGTDIPLESNSTFGIISRYALHHFPNIEVSVNNFYRILEPGGFVITSDPVTYEEDTTHFIDKFQKLKKDGHVHFYKEAELIDSMKNEGFDVSNKFYSNLTYPRPYNEDYEKLFNKTPDEILRKYNIHIKDQDVYITVKVLNIMFRK